MPELDTITVKGFKSIASIEKLKLGAINVLIGPNGSGKSNFIGVFRVPARDPRRPTAGLRCPRRRR